jgi:hypothetical protein
MPWASGVLRGRADEARSAARAMGAEESRRAATRRFLMLVT